MRHFITFVGVDNGDDVRLDVSAICNSTNTSIKDARCTREFKSAAGSASFTIGYTPDKVLDPYDNSLIDRNALYSQAIGYMLECIETKSEMKVMILDDTRTSVKFRGYIDPSDISISRAFIPESISVSCKDYTTDLDKKIGFNLVYEGWSVNAIVDELFSLVYGEGDHGFVGTGNTDNGTFVGAPGLQNGDDWEDIKASATDHEIVGTRNVVSVLPDSKVVDYFVITEDENTTYRQAIDTLLLELGGYVLHYLHSSNRFEIVKCIPDEVDDDAIRTINYLTGEKLSTRTGVYAHDGILLKWPTIESREKDNVYAEDIELEYDADNGILGTMVPNGVYFPTDGDVTETRQEYRKSDRAFTTGASRKKNDDIDLLYAKDAELDIVANQVNMTNRGTVADMDALEALADPVLGNYALVSDVDGEGTSEYRVYDGSAWIYTSTPSLTDGKGNIYTGKGSVATYSDLPSGATEGDFYVCLDTKYQWCWMDGEWQRKISEFLFPVLNTPDVDMVDGNPAFYPRSMWALGRNRSGGLVNLKAMSVTATSVARTKVNKTTQPSTIKDPEEYEAKYVFNSTDAEAFALWLYNSHRIACTTATWYEWEDQRTPLSTLGERVRVEVMPNTEAVFCVMQIDDQAINRRKRKYRITALLVSGFETNFSGNHVTTVQPTLVNQRKVVSTVKTYASSTSGTTTPDSWSDTRTIEKGKYTWERTIVTYSDGTEEISYSVTYNGSDPKMWSFTISRSSVKRNLRAPLSPNDIVITADTTGHPGIVPLFTCTGSSSYFTSTGTQSAYGTSLTLRILASEATDSVTVTMAAGGGPASSKSIEILDNTYAADGMYIGEVSAIPTNPLIGGNFLSGDYFIAASTFQGTDGNQYDIGVPYVYNGSSWYNQMDLSDSENVPKVMQCLGGVMKSNIAVPSSAALWGWFQNLVAQNAVIQNLFARAINILSNGYIRGGDRYKDDNTGTMATNAWNKSGFWFGADGRLMANLQSDANNNTFVGTSVATANASVGSYNTAMGYGALHSNASGGNYNVALGDLALYSATTADHNIAIGHQALYSDATASYNIGIGYQALHTNREGTTNLAIGYQALYTNTGSNNIGIGYQALYTNGRGSANLAIGYQALYTTTGFNNIGIGYQALHTNGAGSTNLAIGYQALYATTGPNNIGIGYQALYTNGAGFTNLAIGYRALYTNTGSSNIGIGDQALYDNTTGDFNMGVGDNALRGVTTGRYNIGLGADSNVYSGSGHYQTAIGDSFICLEFNSGRRYSAVFNALKWAFNTYGMVSCIGFYGPSRVESISYMLDDDDTPCIRVVTWSSDFGATSIYMYGNSLSSDTLSDRLVVMMPKPKNMPNHTNDCLS